MSAIYKKLQISVVPFLVTGLAVMSVEDGVAELNAMELCVRTYRSFL